MADVQWQSTLDTLKQQLQGIDRAATTAEAIPDAACGIFQQAATEKWSNNRLVFTYGQVDPDLMIPCCRAGLALWWPVFTARAYFGDLEGLKKVYDAYQQDSGANKTTINMSSALTWVSHPYNLAEGFANKIEAPVVRQLLAWGADPNHDNGEYFEKALRNCSTDVIGAFLDAGGSPDIAYRVLDEMTAAKNVQGTKISASVSGRSLYAKIDDQTLSETKHVPGPEGGGVFRTLFNFRARRVNEIYEYGHDRKAVMNSAAFADYDLGILDFARTKLEKLGGHPADEGQALDKPCPPARGSLAS